MGIGACGYIFGAVIELLEALLPHLLINFFEPVYVKSSVVELFRTYG